MAGNRGSATSAVTIIFTVLCTAFVAARFYTRIFLVRSVKQDDYWILAAWVCALGFSASICVGVHYGLGNHASDISAPDFKSLRKAEYAFSVLYNPSLMLTKTAIIIFFLSVMSADVDPIFKWSNWLTLAVVNIAGLALTFLNIFQCKPVSAGYQYPTPQNASCTDIVTLYLSSAPVNIITDLAILFLPMPILTGMRLPKKQKIILIVTFSFGAFVAAVDVVRIAYLQNASVNRFKSIKGQSSSNIRISEQNDFPYYASLSFMWSAVEVNLGIICACVPSLKPLFSKFLPSFIRDVGEEMTPIGSSIDEGTEKSNSLATVPTGPNASSQLTNPAAFRKPSVKEYNGEDDGDEMGFLNMLAGPDDDAPQLKRRGTGVSLSRISTSRSVVSDFDFVSMGGTKNMLKLSNSESVWPIAVVTIVFFLWGFAYGLLDTLNAQFQAVVHLSTVQSLGLHAAYFGGYLIGPLTLGRFMMKKYGFKASMMAGLCVYGCGTLVFWPSAVLISYVAFLISNFIVAFGLSCLEIAANPYIALCGPLEYAEVRLNLSQAFQAVGSVLSSLLANKVLFKSITDPDSLVNVQWTYLGIALFVIALAVVFYYIRLPEATDEQLQELADRRDAVYNTRVGPYKVVWVTLALGVFSQWCYVGGQEVVGDGTESVAAQLMPTSSLTGYDFNLLGHTVFALGRFISAFLNYILKPRWILMMLYVGLIICCGLQMGLLGTPGISINMLSYFFESGIFSIIFAMSMRGMGSHTKTASAFMTAAISGGAVPPFIQWAVRNSKGLRYSYCVPTAVFAFGMIFPIYLNLVPAAKKQVDPTHDKRRERRAMRRRQSEMSDLGAESRKFGLVGILARRRKKAEQSHEPTAQHIERSSNSEVIMKKSDAILGKPMKNEEKSDDFLRSPSPVAVKEARGTIGELAPWPSKDDPGRGQSSSEADSDAIERDFGHENNDDDDFDDYHRHLRGM